MAIVNATIKKAVSVLIEQTKVMEPAAAQQAFATGLANIIEMTIKSATVTLPSNSIVTTGGPATQTNLVPAIGSLS